MPFSRDSAYDPPGFRSGITPAEARARFHTSSLSDVRQTCPPRGPMKISRLVTGGPSATFHGKVISTGGNRFMWARRASATGPGSGTSRSLPPFGGAKCSAAELSDTSPSIESPAQRRCSPASLLKR
jgi:hypothetical protein